MDMEGIALLELKTVSYTGMAENLYMFRSASVDGKEFTLVEIEKFARDDELYERVGHLVFIGLQLNTEVRVKEISKDKYEALKDKCP